MIRIEECILYRDFAEGEVLRDMTILVETYKKLVNAQISLKDRRFRENMSAYEPQFYEALNRLVEMANRYGFSGNLWHDYLTYLLVNKKMHSLPRARLSEKVREASTRWQNTTLSVSKNCLILISVFLMKFLSPAMPLSSVPMRTRTVQINCSTKKSGIVSVSWPSVWQRLHPQMNLWLIWFSFTKISEWENWDFTRHFVFAHTGENVEIIPITNIPDVRLSDLVGYEIPKQKLIDNTKAFVEGKKANNCLLFGDAGTGKSSSIKGILNEYYDQGLRMIEVYKHQFQDLNELIAQIKNRNYKFIIYMDDLSFEEFEIEYKYLKAVIEGGLEKKPKNVLIYATSNRRHLIRETFRDKQDRDEDMHTNDTVQEKLSLVARFGVYDLFRFTG